MFIMIDGIDGSGKSTVLEAWKKHLTQNGNTIFDLKEYWKKTGQYPGLTELRSYDFIISGEPTYAGIGAVIRQELINKNNSYPAKSIAEAYALDRLILYKSLLIPLLEQGKCVLQDRGVTTSLNYQHVLGGLDLEFLTNLDGNRLALEHRPDHLVLVQTDPATAMARLIERHEKQDNVIFEESRVQKKFADFFASPTYEKIFTARGATVHRLSGDTERVIMQQSGNNLLTTILAS